MSAVEAARAAPTIQYEQATSYRRLAARFIDLIVAGFVLMPLSLLAMALLGSQIAGLELSEQGAGWIWMAVWLVLIVVYDVLMHRLLGKTLGKLAVGIRLIDPKGGRLGWGRCLLRTVVMIVTGLLVIAGIALTASILGWILLRALPKYTRFPHDRAARSFVVREHKGQLKPAPEGAAPEGAARQRTPLADLERLRDQGMISQEEYERKKQELGL